MKIRQLKVQNMKSEPSDNSLFTDVQSEFLATFSQHRYHAVLATLFDQSQKARGSYKERMKGTLEFNTEEEERKYFEDLTDHHEKKAKHFWSHAQKNYPVPFRKFSDYVCNEHVFIGDKFIDWVVNSFHHKQAPSFYWEKYIPPSLFEEIEL